MVANYDKIPNEITRNMVEDWNSKKRDHNREVEHRNNFKVGDRVKM